MLPIIKISNFQIQTFFLIMALIFSLGFFLAQKRAEQYKLEKSFILDLTLVVAVFGFIGARLFHILFENAEHYTNDPIKILYFWEGGFVFYGGFILAFFAGLFFVYLKNKMHDLLRILDLSSVVISLSYIIGRFGCFLTGCCYGKFCNLPWALNQRHPTQIYSMIWELGIFCFLLGFENKKTKMHSGLLFIIWVLTHSTGRLIIEFFRDDFRGEIYWVSISSWISIILILFSIFIIGFLGRKNQID